MSASVTVDQDLTLTHPALAVVQHARHALQLGLIGFLRPLAILNLRKASIGRTHHGKWIARMLGPGRGRVMRGVFGESDALARAEGEILFMTDCWIRCDMR